MASIDFITFHKPWFSGAPVNAKHSSGVLTFVGTVGDGELVTVHDEVFEFDTDDSVTSGHIAVDVSSAVTAAAAVTALALAMEDSAIVEGEDGDNDTVDVTSLYVGDDKNYVVTTNVLNATFSAATMTGGQYATPARTATIISISDVFYCTQGPVSKHDEDGWYSAALTTL